jgi:hypothetical protein
LQILLWWGKDKQINKGLDLEVVSMWYKFRLKISWKDYLIIPKSVFNKSLADATANLKETIYRCFLWSFEANSKGTVKLHRDILQTEVYRGRWSWLSNDWFWSSESYQRKVDESVESAFGVWKRIDKFGVTQPNIH